MRIIADYHTHTIYSHGIGTIEENVISAIKKGLKIVAITDHGPGYIKYGIHKWDYKQMRDDIDRLKEKYLGVIEILLGIEANVMDIKGNLDVDDDILKYNDILLTGFHFDIIHKDFLSQIRATMGRGKKLELYMEENLYKEMVEANTQALIKSMDLYHIDIITHPGDKQPINISSIAKAAGEKNTCLEINNFHRYPNVSQIKEAMQYEKVNFIISSDAHRPRDVGNFLGAFKVVNQAGLELNRVRNVFYNENKKILRAKTIPQNLETNCFDL